VAERRTMAQTFLNEPYSTFSKRLTDWLNTAGGEVTNLTLDLINRAQYRLATYRAWDGLITHYALEMHGLSAVLPDDFYGAVCRVYVDVNGDNKPDVYYYRDAQAGTGYLIKDTFTKEAGHRWEIIFFARPQAAPIIVYPRALPDFTGSGIEYSFFPPELLLAAAKVIHIEESDLVGDEYNAIQRQYLTLLRDYEQAHQYQNTELRMAQIDASGKETEVVGYDLGGGDDEGDNAGTDYALG